MMRGAYVMKGNYLDEDAADVIFNAFTHPDGPLDLKELTVRSECM